LRPVLLALVAAIVWGVWWIPIRQLEDYGLNGAWGGVGMNAGACLALVVWALSQGQWRINKRALVGTILAGLGVASFAASINHTDVARAVLLFYLAPAWSKLIEWAFMGYRWQFSTTIALISSLSGAFLVMGADLSGAGIGLGDGLALLSGLAWASGAALVFSAPKMSPATQAMFVCGAAAICGTGLGIFDAAPSLTTTGIGLAGLYGVLYVVPVLLLTMWSAQILRPSLLSFILTAEILSGIISAAILLDEPFGLPQILGAILIISGALVELIPGTRKAQSTSL